jgi:hypothetical protein
MSEDMVKDGYEDIMNIDPCTKDSKKALAG